MNHSERARLFAVPTDLPSVCSCVRHVRQSHHTPSVRRTARGTHSVSTTYVRCPLSISTGHVLINTTFSIPNCLQLVQTALQTVSENYFRGSGGKVGSVGNDGREEAAAAPDGGAPAAAPLMRRTANSVEFCHTAARSPLILAVRMTFSAAARSSRRSWRSSEIFVALALRASTVAFIALRRVVMSWSCANHCSRTARTSKYRRTGLALASSSAASSPADATASRWHGGHVHTPSGT